MTQVAANLPATFQKWTVHTLSQKFEEATKLDTVQTAKVVEALKPHEVLIRNHYVAINASDINYTAGRYDPRLRPPFDCGFESLGEIVAVGAKVRHLKLGQPVTAMSNGAFTEFQVLPNQVVIPVPSTRPEILALLVSGLTASLALEIQGQLGRVKGETVLITAAAGGAGQIAVQLAKLAGSHVIGTCSSDEKAAYLKSIGCDRVINYKKEDVGQVLKKEYRKGIDIIFESVGGKTLTDCYNNLAVKGRLIIIGAIATYQDEVQGGPINAMKSVMKDQVPTTDLLTKSACVTGFFLNHYNHLHAEHLRSMTRLVEAGLLKPTLDMSGFDGGIKSVPAAVAYLHSGKNKGKVVVPITRSAGAKL
ncbi:Prostaglandin reductase 3 [Phlyctochytrium planicorne]|nr:Prostaglandin reductase 3 [Phlyctochytrium planicorne]